MFMNNVKDAQIILPSTTRTDMFFTNATFEWIKIKPKTARIQVK